MSGRSAADVWLFAGFAVVFLAFTAAAVVAVLRSGPAAAPGLVGCGAPALAGTVAAVRSRWEGRRR